MFSLIQAKQTSIQRRSLDRVQDMGSFSIMNKAFKFKRLLSLLFLKKKTYMTRERLVIHFPFLFQVGTPWW